ncbi:hypothetical protein KBZ93_01870 [Synechocystis sp. PCC 6803]|nr:hypothetical protein KBZ93_01870 [Synechocystis sp. PCC 6803]
MDGASWRSRWAQRLSWLISALSGTLEIEAETERLKQENAKLDEIILQTKKETERLRKEKKPIEKEIEQIKKETEQIRKENERLAVLESKIEDLFSKHGINLPLAQKPEQP